MRTIITRISCVSLLLLLLFNVCKAADDYCTPPFFDKLGTGPLTGIVNVKLEGETTLDNTTPFNDKYKYFDELSPVEIEKGKQYNLSITLENSQSSWAKLQARVWIDWNHDFDFDDEGEEVFAKDETDTLSFERIIKVPDNAAIGITRMRVYEDMAITAGHIAANPCGYINDPGHPIGQHGNIEDYDIKISGTGTPQPELTLSKDTLDFGEDVVNETDTLTLYISNTGDADLEITQIQVGGADRNNFSFQAASAPFSIKPGDSTETTVMFSPDNIRKYRASIYVLSSDTSGPGIVRLAGVGIAEAKPKLTLSVEELDFGEIYNNQTKQMEFYITNSGNAPLMVAVLMIKGKDAALFSLSGFNLPLNIPAGDSATINVEFAPAEKGEFAARIIIGSNATEQPIELVVIGRSSGPNSVWEDSNIKSLSLTPNPASETINIQFELEQVSLEETHLYIVDISGNKVKTINNNQGITGGQNLTININELPAGKYFLIIESGGKFGNYPLIIVR